LMRSSGKQGDSGEEGGPAVLCVEGKDLALSIKGKKREVLPSSTERARVEKRGKGFQRHFKKGRNFIARISWGKREGAQLLGKGKKTRILHALLGRSFSKRREGGLTRLLR